MDFAVDVHPDQAWSSIAQSISAAKGAESSIPPAQNGLFGHQPYNSWRSMIQGCWILYRIVRDRVRRGWDIDSALFGSCTRPDGNFGSSAAEHCEPSRLQQAQSGSLSAAGNGRCFVGSRAFD